MPNLTSALALPERYLRLVLRTLGVAEDERLHGIRGLVESLLENGVRGDVLVAGLQRDRAAVFVRALLASNRATGRWVWVASPQGSWRELDGVREAFAAAELLDDDVRFVPGPMWDALPVVPLEHLALLHLAAGTGDAVEHLLRCLYARVSRGGFVVVDQYATQPEIAAAVERFVAVIGHAIELRALGAGSVAWRKDRV